MTALDTFEVPTAVVEDLYRDVHKAIRVGLFTATATAGRTDPNDDAARAGLALSVRDLVDFLDQHAEHEDGAVAPVLEVHLPELGEKITEDHRLFEGRGAYLVDLADAVAEAHPDDRRILLHALYLDLAGFTSIYLAHQDIEERTIMPALEAAVGPEQTFAIHQQILAGIAPDDMARALAMMLPAMNLDDRTDMLSGMQAGAPPEVFQGVFGLASTVLEPADHAALARRLGLA
ncbi:hemerythrin domain-containing protein [Aquihabitans sp. McL0605]|uniref:hemerythrin domain-containing protein n=1 Tax=Aquihabitans sp. McL0605 TaxID=3415671 RepID=UPI003CF290FA